MPVRVFILLIIVFFFTIVSIIKYYLIKHKDFNDEIINKLRRKNIKLIKNSFPGIFKVGPFKNKKILEFKIAPVINGGAIQIEKSYYRILDLQTASNSNTQIWAKITTHWFKPTRIEFKPTLESLK
jgi:hypothetical protein